MRSPMELFLGEHPEYVEAHNILTEWDYERRKAAWIANYNPEFDMYWYSPGTPYSRLRALDPAKHVVDLSA